MSKNLALLIAVLVALAVVAVACSSDADTSGETGDDTAGQTDSDTTQPDDTSGETGDDDAGEPVDDAETGEGGDIDYQALGLWDDGPCDESSDPLVVGIMTVFESPVISLVDQAVALEAAADAFNTRGGANGACVEVHTCDDEANFETALACVRDLEGAGVVATVNDQGSVAQTEVSAAMAEAGIPRVGGNVTNNDWADQNAYPIDASGTGSTFLMPQALIQEGITEIGLVRVDLPAAGAMAGLFETLFEGDDATFPVDVAVPAGTTDYSQFILAAENGGVGGIILAVGEQEAIQVVRAGQQLGTELQIGASLGTFS
ncbi:MAG: ABC transporter substrate-binding protein, partial [Actinomycetota bacterium]|nr:ABC transporter substrate-binding protein [Actinomycetota bacterium]